MTDEPTNPLSVDGEGMDGIITQLNIELVKIANNVQAFEQILGPLQAGFHGLSLPQLLRLYAALCDIYDVGGLLQKFKNREGATIERIANEIMMEDGTEAIIQDGYKYEPDNKNCYNIKESDKAAFLEWARKDPIANELIKEDIHHKSRDSMLDDMVEQGLPLPAMVSHYPKPILKRRKQRSK